MSRRPSARATWTTYLISLIVALVLQIMQLPDAFSAARPLLIPMLLSYWALREPQLPMLLPAFLVGLLLDLLLGTPLGQHAVGLVVVVYLAVSLRTFFIVFPLWQATLVLIPCWAIYCFLMFWIDGATHHNADSWLRWLPALSTSLSWPLLWSIMEMIRRPGEED